MSGFKVLHGLTLDTGCVLSGTARPNSGFDCILVADQGGGFWLSLLEKWGFPSRQVTPDELADLPPLKTPGILFFDLNCGSAGRKAYEKVKKRWKDVQSVTIALIYSRKGTVARADLVAAGALRVDDFLMSESPPAVVAARVHFAFMRFEDKADIAAMPASSWLYMSPVPVKAKDEVITGMGRLIGYQLDHQALRTRIMDGIAYTKPDMVTALIFINVDRFSRIITRFGKDRGDYLMAITLMRIRNAVASRLNLVSVSKLALASSSAAFPVVSRMGTKEFAILLPNMSGQAEVMETVQLILRVLAEPSRIDNQSVYLSASAGVALAPKDATDADSLMSAARSAVSTAKHAAGNHVAFYAPDQAASEARKMDTEHRLREAMAHGELEMYYQPQVNVRTGMVQGLEALVRWNHPDIGLIGPENFIPIAEEAGISAELGCWAIRSAIKEIRSLEENGLPRLRLSINVSADMFANLSGSELVNFLITTLAEFDMPTKQLTLEITERTIVDENGNAPRVIDDLKTLGIGLALDDFGTGYSSLSYLKVLPIDELKIDRSFIVGNANEDRALLRAIISMANTLNMSVVAEGVETQEQLVRLYEEGCDLYQGYLCSPPVPGARLMSVVGSMFAGFHGRVT